MAADPMTLLGQVVALVSQQALLSQQIAVTLHEFILACQAHAHAEPQTPPSMPEEWLPPNPQELN